MTSLLNMTESGCADQSQNDSFQNKEEQASTSGLPLRRRKQSPPILEPLMKKKAPIKPISSCDCQQCIGVIKNLFPTFVWASFSDTPSESSR